MSFYDWNNDGKKDVADDFIEYELYTQSTQDSNNSSGGGVSNFGAGAGVILTILITAYIIGSSDLEGIPLAIVFFVLCAVIGGGIAWIFNKIGF